MRPPPALTEVLEHDAGRCDPNAVDTDLSSMRMRQLLTAVPKAREVLKRHGVDPLQRCHSAALDHMTLKQVLGRTCPVDDAEATFAELGRLLRVSAIEP